MEFDFHFLSNGPGYIWTELQLRQDNMNRLEWTEHNRNEAIKWWCKCFLLNIQNLFVAYQNEDAYVHSIKKQTVRELWMSCVSSLENLLKYYSLLY